MAKEMRGENNKYKKIYSKKIFLIDLLISIIRSIIAILIKNRMFQFDINTMIFDVNFVMLLSSSDMYCISGVLRDTRNREKFPGNGNYLQKFR